MNRNASYGCSDYREEMILVGLHERLRRSDLSEEERAELEKEIERLEKALYRG